MRTALIDADVFLYTAASANEYECRWDEWLHTLHADLPSAIAQFQDTVGTITEDLQADRVIMALTDSVNWRKSVMPAYKSQRAKTRKPVIYKALREWVAEHYDVFQRPGLEGDDVLGILSTGCTVKGERIIVSLDKDMQSIPGLLLNDNHARKGMAVDKATTYVDYVKEVTTEQADYFHAMQTLTGDTTDGYPGCPGVGPVKAAKLLEGATPEERWPRIVAAYAKVGLSEEVALQNARVARILRSSDFNFERKEPKLWSPS